MKCFSFGLRHNPKPVKWKQLKQQKVGENGDLDISLLLQYVADGDENPTARKMKYYTASVLSHHDVSELLHIFICRTHTHKYIHALLLHFNFTPKI